MLIGCKVWKVERTQLISTIILFLIIRFHSSIQSVDCSFWMSWCPQILCCSLISLLSQLQSVSKIAGWLKSNSSLLRSPGRFTPESTCQTPFPSHSLLPLSTQPAATPVDLHMELVYLDKTLDVTLHKAMGNGTNTFSISFCNNIQKHLEITYIKNALSF